MPEAPVKWDAAEGAREMVDLQAEAVNHLGSHLVEIGDLISKSVMPPRKGERGSAMKLQGAFGRYVAYCDDVKRRQAELEAKIAEDYQRMIEWRKNAGLEGSSMVETMEKLFDESRALKNEVQYEQGLLYDERCKIQGLVTSARKKDRKFAAIGEAYVQRIHQAGRNMYMRAGLCCWVQSTFADVRFKFKAAEEKEQLKLDYMKKLRKARSQARLDATQRGNKARLLQSCIRAIQEESVENRHARHLEALRLQHSDELLCLGAQLAQAIGDEDKAVELLAEQQRRIEAAKEAQLEAEQNMRLAQKDARDARAERDREAGLKRKALAAESAAIQRAEAAETDAKASRKLAEQMVERADASDQARIKAEKVWRDAEEAVRKQAKKIASLQRMIAELGGESDSDAPPDERPPAFFVNEDGTRLPRERTRKERMGMAYREAESARYELRLGMAAMLDKDVNSAAEIQRLITALGDSQREVSIVREALADSQREGDALRKQLSDLATASAVAEGAGHQDATQKQAASKTLAKISASSVPTMLAFSPSFSPFAAGAFGAASPLLARTARNRTSASSVPALEGQRSPEGKLHLQGMRPGKRRASRQLPRVEWHVGWH